jgi:hypothetical protein
MTWSSFQILVREVRGVREVRKVRTVREVHACGGARNMKRSEGALQHYRGSAPRRTMSTARTRYNTHLISPPSTCTLAPVTYPAASESKNAATRPNSGGSP